MGRLEGPPNVKFGRAYSSRVLKHVHKIRTHFDIHDKRVSPSRHISVYQPWTPTPVRQSQCKSSLSVCYAHAQCQCKLRSDSCAKTTSNTTLIRLRGPTPATPQEALSRRNMTEAWLLAEMPLTDLLWQLRRRFRPPNVFLPEELLRACSEVSSP